MATYKRQTVGTRICLGVLSDVPIRHPRTHDANRKQFLRNLDDGEHIRMKFDLALSNYMVVCLE